MKDYELFSSFVEAILNSYKDELNYLAFSDWAEEKGDLNLATHLRTKRCRNTCFWVIVIESALYTRMYDLCDYSQRDPQGYWGWLPCPKSLLSPKKTFSSKI